MDDRKKVIKGIQECDLNGGCIGNCPYKGILDLLKEQQDEIYALQVELASANELAEGYAELLKEQEPVKPRYTPPKSIYSWECGVCAEPFDRIANYCPKCGRRVKWG